MSGSRQEPLGGHAADATAETMPFLIWRDAVYGAVIGVVGEELRGVGYTGDWLRTTQRDRVALKYRTGEPVWMAAEALAFLAKGAVLAAAEDSDHRALRDAWKRARRVSE